MYVIRYISRPSSVLQLCESIHDWAGYIEDVGRHWWIAVEKGDSNDEWVGFSGLQIYDKTTVLLSPTKVNKEARGHGLQIRFIKAREQWARKHGYKVAISLTNYDNIISANHLIKCGYRLRKPWPGQCGLGLYLTKTL